MKVKSLLSLLNQTDSESEVICGTHNGYVDTYGVVDHIWEDYFDHSVYNDLYGTPGQIDGRLITKDIVNPNNKIVFIGSEFPVKHGVGNNDINYNIQQLNDDPNYLWEQNQFELVNDDECDIFWEYLKEFTKANDNGDFEYEMINYYKIKDEDFYTCELHCRRDLSLPSKIIFLYNPGLEDLRNAMELLGFEKKLIV